jgi:hypothetical protein
MEAPGPKMPARVRKSNLSLHEVQSVLASFFYAYAVAQKPNYEAQHPSLWLTVMTIPETLFGQPRSTTERWIDFVHQNEDHEAYASRLAFRFYDEVAPVFGVDEVVGFSLVLSDARVFLAQRMKSDFENEELMNTLRIAALKIRGNPALVGKRGCGSAIMVFLALTAALASAVISLV